MKCYVAQVMTGEEKEIKYALVNAGIKAVVPERFIKEKHKGKWTDILKVVFTSYVFIFVQDMDTGTYYKIKDILGTRKLLGDDNGPAAVPEEELNFIFRWTGNGDVLGISTIYKEGSQIVVVSGPLKGQEGRIISVDARRLRAKVNVSIMGEPRVVDLAVNVIQNPKL